MDHKMWQVWELGVVASIVASVPSMHAWPIKLTVMAEALVLTYGSCMWSWDELWLGNERKENQLVSKLNSRDTKPQGLQIGDNIRQT